jgi:hypothetical protein
MKLHMPKNPPKYLEHRFARISMGGGGGGGVRRAEMVLCLELSCPPSLGQALSHDKFNVSKEVV